MDERDILEKFDDWLYDKRHNDEFLDKYDSNYFEIQNCRRLLNEYIKEVSNN